MPVAGGRFMATGWIEILAPATPEAKECKEWLGRYQTPLGWVFNLTSLLNQLVKQGTSLERATRWMMLFFGCIMLHPPKEVFSVRPKVSRATQSFQIYKSTILGIIPRSTQLPFCSGWTCCFTCSGAILNVHPGCRPP